MDDETAQPMHDDTRIEPTSERRGSDSATSVKGSTQRKRNIILAGVAVLALLGGGGGALAAHNAQAADASACSKAVQTLNAATTSYDNAVTTAQTAVKHAKDTGYDQTADGKKATDNLSTKATPRGNIDTTCKTKSDADALTNKANGLDTAGLNTAAATLTQQADAHRVTEAKSSYDKALANLKAKIDAANHKIADTDGKVADSKTRDDLKSLVDEAQKLADTKVSDTDASALDAATKKLNDEAAKFDGAVKAVDDSVAKKEADDKAAADQQAAAQTDNQAATQTDTSTQTDSQAPVTQPQQQAPVTQNQAPVTQNQAPVTQPKVPVTQPSQAPAPANPAPVVPPSGGGYYSGPAHDSTPGQCVVDPVSQSVHCKK